MRIDKLQLKNFKGFEQQEFEFHQHFNLIVGENGAGKTSVIDALSVAAASWFLGVRGYDTRHIVPDDIRRKGYYQGDTLTIEEQYPVEVTAFGQVGNHAIEWTRRVEAKGGKTTRIDAKRIQTCAEHAAMAVQSGHAIILPIIANYSAGRLWVPAKDMRGDSEKKKERLDSRLDGYRFSIDPRINFADLFRWFEREKYVSLEKGRERFGFQTVKKAMLSCMEGVLSIDYSVSEEKLIAEMDGRGFLPFHLLSDGQRAMLALVADIAFKGAQLNPHLEDRVLDETPGVILIDELDLHLHPRWQRHVVADLKKTFPKIQFFATTHSPQVIGETPPEEIILLRKDGTWTRPKQTVGLSSNQVLADIMDAEAMNQDMQEKFDAIFALIEAGNFREAREEISTLRDGGKDFPELQEAEGFMDSISSSEDEKA